MRRFFFLLAGFILFFGCEYQDDYANLEKEGAEVKVEENPSSDMKTNEMDKGKQALVSVGDEKNFVMKDSPPSKKEEAPSNKKEEEDKDKRSEDKEGVVKKEKEKVDKPTNKPTKDKPDFKSKKEKPKKGEMSAQESMDKLGEYIHKARQEVEADVETRVEEKTTLKNNVEENNSLSSKKEMKETPDIHPSQKSSQQEKEKKVDGKTLAIQALRAARAARNGKGSKSVNNSNEKVAYVNIVVHNTQVVKPGQTIIFLTKEDVIFKGWSIPKNTMLFGVASISDNRLNVDINLKNVLINGERVFIPGVRIIDLDGREGIRLQGANVGREVGKAVGNTARNMGLGYLGTAGSAVAGLVDGIANNVRTNKNPPVTLYNNYKLTLELRDEN